MEQFLVEERAQAMLNQESLHSPHMESVARRIQELKKNGAQAFSNLGFPTSKLEEWKYTNLAFLQKKNFVTGSVSIKNSDISDDISPLGVNRLVFVNGHFASSLSHLEEVNGLSVQPLSELFLEQSSELSAIVESRLGAISQTDSHALSAFNAEHFGEVAIVHVKKNSSVEEPIELVFITSTNEADVLVQPRVLVVMERHAQATVIERYLSASKEFYLTNTITELYVEEGAILEHVRLCEEGEASVHTSAIFLSQQAKSRCALSSFSFGGSVVRNEVYPVLQGSGSDTLMYGLSVLSGKQHVDNSTVIDHATAHCESTELYKGIYAGQSKGVFSGTIIVRPHAQKTNAIQSNQSLLLSDSSSIETRPQLKIWADDVKCTHGATVGQLDEKALFYLRSRGIEEALAKQLLIQAFAGDVVQHLSDEALKKYVYERLEKKLDICLGR